jgi:hypothetical protein
MEDQEIRTALDRHWAASDANDLEAEHDIYREDAVLEYPQSGERIRGRRHIQSSRAAQPNRKRFTVRRIIGATNLWVTEYILTYDEQPSYTVSIMEFRDGKVARETQYFGDSFEPGPSRAMGRGTALKSSAKVEDKPGACQSGDNARHGMYPLIGALRGQRCRVARVSLRVVDEQLINRRIRLPLSYQAAVAFFKDQHGRMGVGEIEVGHPADGAPCREHDVEFALADLPCVVNVGANKGGRHADFHRQARRFGAFGWFGSRALLMS